MDRFLPRVVDRFLPRVMDRFLPRVVDRFLPRVVDRFLPHVVGRFLPRVVDRFLHGQFQLHEIPQHRGLLCNAHNNEAQRWRLQSAPLEICEVFEHLLRITKQTQKLLSFHPVFLQWAALA